MHEYSIVTALIEQCETLGAENQAKAITRVEVKIGMLSGVEPALLSQAFETFKLDGICANAQFNMQIQPLVLQCHQCGQTSEQTERTIICSHCQSNNTQIIDGEDMMLMQLEMDT
ncbi:hydrogenase maturation nickel metallochaperone HypA [Shewanella intestini]|uniref:Hydrogenase maturation factor HypA n=1 Tax=Shewanella intestini TaxID=2017544 RepID=A0ABS5I1X4_9GAMM|nr:MULTISPECIES: hydrogenase maturation nickel metallochaperone HypA [Shewanella]MBR9728025.1 hydrogenase maturation nickel metallochaperone HypA [Shewanella intestini]MRG36424.1 hydrogenase maturation nickel metallochaperone HypA [Shewanella sp. XMDDZSB0408]